MRATVEQPEAARASTSRGRHHARGTWAQVQTLVRTLRVHQWLKNLLLLVAPLASHRLDGPLAVELAFGIFSLSLCASACYVLNDVLDVDADRQHSRKRHRALATGELSRPGGLLLSAAAGTLGVGLAVTTLPPAFLVILTIYAVVSLTYSMRLKREPILDVMVLAGLYVTRVVAGGIVSGIAASRWLLAFTLFASLSLAFLKRFIEVRSSMASSLVPGRGYLVTDAAWLHNVGATCAYLAVVVVALYTTSPDVDMLYRHPERLLLVCPLLFYWTTRLWLRAHRGTIHDDPLVAVFMDPASYVIALFTAAVVLSAI